MLFSSRRGVLFFLFFIVVTPITLSLLVYYPQYNIYDEQHLLETYQALLKSDSLPQPAHDPSSQPSLISVMTFNLRFDAEESDPNNRFPRRIPRIISIIERWNPHIIGVQEPFSDELIQLFSVWRKEKEKRDQEEGEEREVPYIPVGFKWPSPSNYVKVVVVPSTHSHTLTFSLTHHSSFHAEKGVPFDYKVGILYNARILELLEQDYLWLSKTPRIIESKHWNSSHTRCLNIARFRLRQERGRANAGDEEGTTLLVFNTHLDVTSEEARREQSKLVLKSIKEWRLRYPQDPVFLTGDFNSAPGQAAYTTLTKTIPSQKEDEDRLFDSWVQCKRTGETLDGEGEGKGRGTETRPSCVSNSVSSTFHGWQGSLVNRYLARLIQLVVFTVHGMGVPLHSVNSLSQAWRMKAKLVADLWPISEALPLWPFNRFHVDWILYSSSLEGGERGRGKGDDGGVAGRGSRTGVKLSPKLIGVLDVRRDDYSSDHFPVIALFEIKR